MRDLDTALNSACEWAVSSPRRLTLILIALIAGMPAYRLLADTISGAIG